MRRRVREPSWRSGIRSGAGGRRLLWLAVGVMPVQWACVSDVVSTDSATASPIVSVAGETLAGLYLDDETSVAVFKGIPYAAPPVGEGRWHPPRPAVPRAGLQAATEFGSACVQDPRHVPDWYRYLAESFGRDPALVPELEPTSEDCLYLNVWTANLGGEDRWPVMVWIHGGANNSGSPSERPYDGAALTRRGVVVVSINYRLNVFGFLAHPALTAESRHRSSGNYGLLDQIAALDWIRRNIAAFGGDPERITLFGESAGAANIAYLMASDMARGLFHRSVMQSGGYAVSEFRTLREAELLGEGLVTVLDLAESVDVIAELRQLEAEVLLNAVLEKYPAWESAPNVDGWLLAAAPGHIFESGRPVRVPLLIGFNRDEWTTLGPYGPEVTPEALSVGLRAMYADAAERALDLYPASTRQEAIASFNDWQTDVTFACPSRFIADRMADWSEVFFYQFTRTLPASGGDKLGAYHGAETAYVMRNLALETWVPRAAHDEWLAEVMSDYWVTFAAVGNPNGEERPAWPAYESGMRPYLELGDRIQVRQGIRTDYCDLWDELQSHRLAGAG